MKNIIHLLVFVLVACAKPMIPEGGLKDVEPPKILKSVPDTFSLNFNSKTIHLEFDEYVSIKSPGTEVFSSPPLKNKPDFKSKSKSLTIFLNDTLKENTTYTINFGSAITDNNEGNVLKDFQYIFSTGNYIDSLYIKGMINDAFSGKPLEKAKVMLYDTDIDSLPLSSKPYYYAVTDASGNFKLNYLKEGSYKVFVLKEENDNFIYDLIGESIAFQNELINPTDSSLFLKLLSFVAEDSVTKIKKIESPYYGKLVVKFTRSINLDSLELPYGFSIVSKEFNSKQDSLIFWFKDYEYDTLQVIYRNGQFSDTSVVRIKSPRDYSKPLKSSSTGRGGGQGSDKDELILKLNHFQGNKIHFFDTVKILLNRPLGRVDIGKIFLFESDSIPIVPQISYIENTKDIFLMNTFNPDKDYKLIINDSAIVDFLGASKDSSGFNFRLSSERDYGNAEVNFSTNLNLPTLILELINDKNDVLNTAIIKKGEKKKQLKYQNLLPGNYRIRMIYDDNENNKWDTGSYFMKKQPEKVEYLRETISVRQGWDVSIEWNYTDSPENISKDKRGNGR